VCTRAPGIRPGTCPPAGARPVARCWCTGPPPGTCRRPPLGAVAGTRLPTAPSPGAGVRPGAPAHARRLPDRHL